MPRIINCENISSNNISDIMFNRPSKEIDDYILGSLIESRNFFSNVTSNFRQSYDESIANFNTNLQNINNIAMSFDNIFVENKLLKFIDIDSIINANGYNQLFVMANPLVHQHFINNKCQGYSDSHDKSWDESSFKIDDIFYVPHYSSVRNNSLYFDVERNDENDLMAFTTVGLNNYTDDEIITLSDDDRFLIRDNWTLIEKMIKDGFDPTDIYGGEIGKL